MRDYSDLTNETVTWKTDKELADFESHYKKMIISVIRKMNVEESNCQVIYNDILIKYGRGKLIYDSSRGTFEQFLYRISVNAAKDFYRENKKFLCHEVEITEQNTSHLYDLSQFVRNDFEYFRRIAVETLKRLCRMYHKKLANIEIFTRRFFAGEGVEYLAEKYRKSRNEISLIVSRLRAKYKEIFQIVRNEMESEKLQYSNISLDFLTPIVDFSLSVA